MNDAEQNASDKSDKAPKARYIMIGGFLGAGKTTAMARLARDLSEKGLRVGLITNDQGRNLVDTNMLKSLGFATEEIAGGCFCCRFNSLVDASKHLTATVRPEVFIAEPVGSCTDIAATVTYPLRRLYGEKFTVAPISVMVDPVRAERVLGLAPGSNFSEKVLYVYRKQIEEADLVIINKCDLLSQSRLEAQRLAIKSQFSGKEVLDVSARTGTNLDKWFRHLTEDTQVAETAMKVDYQVYADGEALLGWLNCTVQIATRQPFDANQFLQQLAGSIQERLRHAKAEAAHLKMTFSPDNSPEIAAVNLVRNDFVPELSFRLNEPAGNGQLIINLRAESNPEILAAAVRESLSVAPERHPTLSARLDHLEHFRPGKPTPTHRIEKLER